MLDGESSPGPKLRLRTSTGPRHRRAAGGVRQEPTRPGQPRQQAGRRPSRGAGGRLRRGRPAQRSRRRHANQAATRADRSAHEAHRTAGIVARQRTGVNRVGPCAGAHRASTRHAGSDGRLPDRPGARGPGWIGTQPVAAPEQGGCQEPAHRRRTAAGNHLPAAVVVSGTAAT
jgi:hypothetical protein